MDKNLPSLDFIFKEINESRNCFLEEKKCDELISKKHKKTCRILNSIKHLLILAFSTRCVSVSAFVASLFGVPMGIASSAIGLKFFAITTGIKKYNSIIKKKKKST